VPAGFDAQQQIRENVPGLPVESVAFEGEGDFCRAYTVNGLWIFRFAYNAEGSRALERETALLPRLAPSLNLPVPNIAHFGRQSGSGLTFVGYPRIPGVGLARERLQALEPPERERCAEELAKFLRALHAFSVEEARQLGVIECSYPFCRTEEGIMQGRAAEIYRSELQRLLAYTILDEKDRRYGVRLVEEILSEPAEGEMPASLVHGDLSQDHVMFDPESKHITGIIDFSDVIITSPLLDLVYIYHAYGSAFFDLLLHVYCREEQPGPQQVKAGVRLLHGWYTVLRLLWALDHDYQPGIERGLREVRALRAEA